KYVGSVSATDPVSENAAIIARARARCIEPAAALLEGAVAESCGDAAAISLLACAKDENGAVNRHAQANAIVLRSTIRMVVFFDLHYGDTECDGRGQERVALRASP